MVFYALHLLISYYISNVTNVKNGLNTMLRSDRVKRIPDCLAGILSNATVKIVKAKKKKKK